MAKRWKGQDGPPPKGKGRGKMPPFGTLKGKGSGNCSPLAEKATLEAANRPPLRTKEKERKDQSFGTVDNMDACQRTVRMLPLYDETNSRHSEWRVWVLWWREWLDWPDRSTDVWWLELRWLLWLLPGPMRLWWLRLADWQLVWPLDLGDRTCSHCVSSTVPTSATCIVQLVSLMEELQLPHRALPLHQTFQLYKVWMWLTLRLVRHTHMSELFLKPLPLGHALFTQSLDCLELSLQLLLFWILLVDVKDYHRFLRLFRGDWIFQTTIVTLIRIMTHWVHTMTSVSRLYLRMNTGSFSTLELLLTAVLLIMHLIIHGCR